MGLVTRTVVRWIERYQSRGGGRVFFGVACNFEPSCSEYARQAILQFGLLRGIPMSWRRIRRCVDPNRLEPVPDPVPGANQRAEVTGV